MSRLKRSLVAVLAAGALGLSGCSVYDMPLPGGVDAGEDPMLVKVEFRDVLDLVPQSTVKINDVTVGKVTDVDLRGYTAIVSLRLPKDTDLPDNARAEIRQTSLLGEKFVSLSAPSQPSADKLGNNDVIPLANSGRNPEIEEVLGALGALLSGGGVGQLKLIAEELNTAMDGNESEFRSVISQIRYFTGQLADNKEAIVSALDNLNRLAVQLRRQDSSIKLALDELPAALASVDKQRDDLVKVLRALSRLSDVGTKVIQASKQSTINSLRDLAPVLNQFAAAGQDLPRSLQVFLTYPFVDETVGRDPQVARNLHMGDYTNLSVRLDLDLSKGLAVPPIGLPNDVTEQCNGAKKQLKAQAAKMIDSTPGLSAAQKKRAKEQINKRINGLDCEALSSLDLKKVLQSLISGIVGSPIKLPDLPKLPGLPGLPGLTGDGGGGGLLGLGRPAPGPAGGTNADDPLNLAANGYDPSIGTLLLQGLLGTGVAK